MNYAHIFFTYYNNNKTQKSTDKLNYVYITALLS